jgi:hypothetical protein
MILESHIQTIAYSEGTIYPIRPLGILAYRFKNIDTVFS